MSPDDEMVQTLRDIQSAVRFGDIDDWGDLVISILERMAPSFTEREYASVLSNIERAIFHWLEHGTW